MILILTTVASKIKAKKVGTKFLKEKLIACYNLIPVESEYWWKGKIEKSSEVLMILKTRKEKFSKIEKIIKSESGYEVPEVLSINTENVSSAYLKWLNSEIK